MNISFIINSFGLLLDIVGALLMFYNSQAVSFQTFIYQQKELKELNVRAKKMNFRVKLGAFLMFTGFLLQLIASFINN